ncbi:MAG TPA: NAD-dependent epimerase/dehydratase family protein [Candidatus Paceibacterota bacterium]
MKRNILIIGGAGFIGINAARRFYQAGWNVTLLDNFSRKGTEVNVAVLHTECPDVAVTKADIVTDFDTLKAAVEGKDAVLHLAAQVAVTTSVVDPRNDLEQNILGTFNVLEAIRLSDSKPSLIFSSTNKVYGGLEEHAVEEFEKRYEFTSSELRSYGVPESQPLDFHSPYGCSKGAADQYVHDYARIYGLKTVVLRQSCVYGEHQFGVEDQGWVAWFSIAALFDKDLTIYGTGKQIRDLLYVGDLTELYEILFEKMDTVSGNAYNVGGGPGNTLSLIELIELMRTNLGYTKEPAHAAIRAGDQPIFVADVRSLQKDTGWKPTTSVTEGVGKLHTWIKENESAIRSVLS